MTTNKFEWVVNVTRGNSQTKTKVSFVFDDGKAKCRAHCLMNKSGRVHSDAVDYTLKRVYIVRGYLTLAAHFRREFPSYDAFGRKNTNMMQLGLL